MIRILHELLPHMFHLQRKTDPALTRWSCLDCTLEQADAVVLAVRHQAYLRLDPDEIVGMTGRPVAVVDCFGMLDDSTIRRYIELGCEVKGLGRGHIKRIKDEVRDKR